MKIARSIICLTFFTFTLAAYAGEDYRCLIYQSESVYGVTDKWFVTEPVRESAGMGSEGRAAASGWQGNLIGKSLGGFQRWFYKFLRRDY
jgi:hypothetical protein